ncbi:MAG: hypothetical protein GX444_06830 [Myxococcales bacterium]|nr:hypothetical protein [Myxococcales bacterium]
MRRGFRNFSIFILCLLPFALLDGCDSRDGEQGNSQADDGGTDNDDRDAQPECWEAGGDAPTADVLTPRQSPEYYVEQSLKYFDTLDSYADPRSIPNYSELVARWEWPPWLKLTGLGDEAMIWIDLALKLYPTSVAERDCRAFPVQPFGRCHVVFYYQDRPCSIYEEFTFNDRGEMTFIEAWSDIPGLLPTSDPSDYWAEDAAAHRLSTKIPGLGTATGLIDLNGDCLREAARTDAEVADFATRARYPIVSWMAEFLRVGDDMMRLGCE